MTGSMLELNGSGTPHGLPLLTLNTATRALYNTSPKRRGSSPDAQSFGVGGVPRLPDRGGSWVTG